VNVISISLLDDSAAAVSPAAGQQTRNRAAKATAAKRHPGFLRHLAHGQSPWFIPPHRAPARDELVAESGSGVSNYSELVGDTQIRSAALGAEVVKKKGDLSKAGVVFPNPANTCCPNQCRSLQTRRHAMLQLPNEIVMLFSENHEVRACA